MSPAMLDRKMSEQIYSCLECNFKSSRPVNLRKHLMTKHSFKKSTNSNEVKSNAENTKEEKATYNCDQCDHVATKKLSLKLHVQAKHEGLRFPCDHCDYKATQKATYNCDQC